VATRWRASCRSLPAPGALPDALRAQGYLTQAFVTNPFLSMRYGFARGFDRYQNATMASEAFIALDHTLTLSVLTALWPRFAISDIGETVTGRAEAWLTRHRSEKFFLWLHYIDIHAPYGDPRRLGNKTFRGDHRTLDGKAAAGPSDGSLGDRFVHIARLRAGEIQLNPDQRQELMALYDAGVRYDDEQVGHVLERLEQLDLRAHTVIVVASDHGEEFWEHGGVEHGHTVYEELVRVPLIIAHPDGTPGQRIDAVVRLMDVAPTVADLTGMAAPPALDGRSLRPLLNGDADAPRLALSEALLFADEKRALRTAGLKYIVSANGKQELYDLANDPAELRDLAARDDLLAKQRTLLHNLLAAHETPQAAPRTVDATTRQRLHTLGYGQ
jgi:arylsulfatase A-like enzyme